MCAVASFSLVHGAWHGGWAWDRLRTELEALGHTVAAPDLPCDDPDAGVEEYARVVPPADVVVGHSLGGMTVPLVPAAVLVFLTAYVPEPGKALAERGDEAWGPGFSAALARDDLGRSYWPDLADAARDLQYPPDAAHLVAKLRPQGPRPSRDPFPLDALPDVRYAFVVCARDYAIPPDFQRTMARNELGVEPVELDAGHSPMLTHARELARILDGLV